MFFRKKTSQCPPSPAGDKKGTVVEATKIRKKGSSDEVVRRRTSTLTAASAFPTPRKSVSSCSPNPNGPHKAHTKPKTNKDKKKRETMKHGDVVGTRNQWRVVELLGSGGFGDVYKVVIEKMSPPSRLEVAKSSENCKPPNPADAGRMPDVKTSPIVKGCEYAMKTELINTAKQMARLKVEVNVFAEIAAAESGRRKHFCDIFDRGQMQNGTKFVVMSLVGPSLEVIRKDILKVTNFKQSTTVQIALQTLESIVDLHYIGFIHRDMKPGNFACGIGDKQDIIYMLDFGIARYIFKSGTRELRAVRKRAKFIGTIRYASRAGLRDLEQGRKDDLETWLYMVFHLFDYEKGLPWKGVSDVKKVMLLKDAFFKHNHPECYELAPVQLRGIVKYVDSLCLVDEPDYKKIEKMLINMAENNDISITEPLEWLGKTSAVSKEAKAALPKSADEKQVGNSKSDSTKDPPPKKPEDKKKADDSREEENSVYMK